MCCRQCGGYNIIRYIFFEVLLFNDCCDLRPGETKMRYDKENVQKDMLQVYKTNAKIVTSSLSGKNLNKIL